MVSILSQSQLVKSSLNREKYLVTWVPMPNTNVWKIVCLALSVCQWDKQYITFSPLIKPYAAKLLINPQNIIIFNAT